MLRKSEAQTGLTALEEEQFQELKAKAEAAVEEYQGRAMSISVSNGTCCRVIDRVIAWLVRHEWRATFHTDQRDGDRIEIS